MTDAASDHNETPKDPANADMLAGRVLIAMPSLSEGCFKESVVLICSHDKDHAMGLILNKTISDLSFAKVLEELSIDGSGGETRQVHFGGPVQTKRGAVLHSLDYRSQHTVAVTPSVGMTATKEVLNVLSENSGIPRKSLLCLGHAGWSPGQLEHELASNAWLEGNLRDDILFDTPREILWETALREVGVDPSMFSAEWLEARDVDAPLN